jgi:hypothetical protein
MTLYSHQDVLQAILIQVSYEQTISSCNFHYSEQAITESEYMIRHKRNSTVISSTHTNEAVLAWLKLLYTGNYWQV